MTETAMPDPLAALSDRLAGLAAAGTAATVAVHGRDGRARSGLVWAEGLVVTAEEALERDDDLSLTLPDGRRVPATLGGRDPGTDVALLRAETGPVTPLPLAPAAALAPGHLVLAVGRSEYGPISALGTAALIGGPWRSMRGGRIERRLHLDLRLEAEGEGGPVLDHAGRLVGMSVPGPRRRVLVIPAETIARVAEVLRTRGRMPRGYAGVALQPLALPGGTRGLIVMGVDREGPAAKAGVVLGDILLAWDEAPLGSVREMLERLDAESVGREVTLELLRGGRPMRLTLRISERAAA